ncbi:hypothetical protein SKAU_G00252040 [Synaphobranchus kaupii]|uniref:Glypican-5 n=1 Tax=Synaphobranchus kaupii TaxID=118154 RepID=A0A9Q1IPW4_SYNKA|nr:hypothetical protein SKAU_G00252040 [Synaphobranchus kaupii]
MHSAYVLTKEATGVCLRITFWKRRGGVNDVFDELGVCAAGRSLLQGKSIPQYGTLDRIEAGSGGSDGRFSGDCDDEDEDGCGGSGGGEAKKVLKVSKWNPDEANDRRRSRTHTENVRTAGASAAGSSAQSGPLTLSMICTLAALWW